jgi:photosystem II stability/assembly factor-like uncharacterized protein
VAKLSRSLLLVLFALAATACGSRINPIAALSSGGSGPLDMVDTRIGWAVHGNQLERTTDGAQTFKAVTPPLVSHIDGVYFLNAQQAWVVSTPALEYTSDGGRTWRSTVMNPALDGDPVFVDASHGWLETSATVDDHRVIDRTLWRTVDGGSHWQRVYEGNYKIQIEPNVQKADCSPGFPAWTSETHGIAGVSCPDGSAPALRMTDDGGATWSNVALPPLPSLPGIALGTSVGPIHVERDGGLVTMVSRCIGPDGTSCRFYGELYRSADGGFTWTTGSVVWGAGDALVIDSDHAWLTDACATDECSTPLLMTTADGGVTWKSLTLPQQLWPNMHGNRIFSVASATEAFVITSNEFQPAPKYFRTTDGGRTFSEFTPRW